MGLGFQHSSKSQRTKLKRIRKKKKHLNRSVKKSKRV